MKRKRKWKWKNILLLLFFLLIILMIILFFPFKEEKKKKEKSLPTEEELKLEQLGNIHKKLDYFQMDYLDRYLSYQEKNKDIDLIQVIKNVNMHLDKDFYTDVEPSIHKNTELVLVNKHYYLTGEDVPENLENINTAYSLQDRKLEHNARVAFESLASSAKKEGYSIIAMSTYRSYEYQVTLYNRYVQEDGQELADTYSARAGHSEHQTGLAVDVYNGKVPYTSFESTKEFEWMDKHAHEYGFILRFPKDKVNETGYQYESWHYRYVGIETANYIKEHHISLEEYIATTKKD